jgi:amino acid adenylation domain-containing protein
MSDVNVILLHSGFIRQKGYWEKKLTPGMEATELHSAYTLKGVLLPTGGSEKTSVTGIGFSEDLARKLVAFGKGSDLSVYIVLLTVLKLLIYRCTNNTDITVISPVLIDNVTEDTINRRLYIRDFVITDGTFAQLLLAVRQSLLEAYENQDYPSDKLIEFLFPSDPVTTADSRPVSNITCLLKNIHDPRMIEDEGSGLIFSFEREGDRFRGHISFPFGVYEEDFLRRFAGYYTLLLENCLRDARAPIAGISIASEEETRRLLYDFNATDADYPREKNIHRLFREQAIRTPHNTALIARDELSYKELDEKSDRWAFLLRQKGVGPGSITAVMAERSIEAVTGILAILKAGGAFLPVDPRYPDARKEFILKDSKAKVLLTQSPLTGGSDRIARLMLDSEDFCPVDGPPPEDVNTPRDLAYIIYTSGTTGKPKGVMVEHRGLVNYIWWAAGQYVRGEKLDFPLYTSMSFDLTVTSIFTPLVTGNAVVIYSEGEDDSGPVIDRVIDENKVGVIKLTPSHLKLIRGKQHVGESCIRRFIVGGEELKTSLAKEIRDLYPSAEIYNEYGPTEATVGCMIYKYDPSGDNRSSVSIGVPAANLRIYILDGVLAPVPVGVVGELYISGDGLARGYLNRPELTAEKFKITHWSDRSNSFDRSYFAIYRTGDLAVRREDGNIDFLGRVDQQVKIRGFRIELGEIERRMMELQGVKEAVVTTREDRSGDKYLCAYIVPNRESPLSSGRSFASVLQEHLSRELPDHMIPSYFSLLDSIPLTPHGKVNERALPEPVIQRENEYIPPRSELEKRLAETWTEVLEHPRIGIGDNFFRLGGHSLKATLLVSRIHKKLDVRVPLTEVFRSPTIRQLAAFIESAAAETYSAVEKAEEKSHYPLSSAQKRLYLLHRMDPGSTVYNIPFAMKLEGELDGERLGNTFKQLILRHETLRTSFLEIDNRPVQHVHDHVEFKIIPLGPIGTRTVQEFIRPFDLAAAPLLRVGLAGNSAREHLLVMDMHHIVTDGVSMEILAREFMVLYGGGTLPPLLLQYKDYACWQERDKQRETVKSQEAYWVRELSGERPILFLPCDFSRSPVQRFEGISVRFELDEAGTARLKELANREDVTFFMVLFAVFNLWLSKLSGQEDIIVGTPIAARRRADLDSVVGMFVNTLAVRNFPEGTKSFRQFLAEVKARMLAAYENQEYPFEELVDVLNITRDPGRNPLFDVAFVLQNMESPVITIPGLTLSTYPFESNVSRFDLTMNCEEDSGRLVCTVEYAAALFEKATIERFITYFMNTANRTAREADAALSEIEIISDKEKETLLNRFNDTRTPYPSDMTIHQLFERQSDQNPDSAAVVYESSAVTYRELDTAAGRLAAVLREKGVNTGTPVGVMIERSLEMVAALIAVLKAGGAYLPVNPSFPDARVNYMFADSSTPVVITGGELARKIAFDTETVLLQNMEPRDILPPVPLSPCASDLAYIMYTSGSTGIPKGVLVEHRNVVRLVRNTNFVEFRSRDRILQTGALEFDASTFEIWGALLNGLTICLADRGNVLTPRLLKVLIRRYDISTMWMTSALFNQMSDADIEIFETLTSLLVGGDALSTPHINRLRDRYPRLNVINGYGPTENTTFSTTFRIDRNYRDSVPIGRPIANSTAYIVDKYDRCVPVGVPGELTVGGDGVSRGYLNDPQLTAERFRGNKTYGAFRTDGSNRFYRTGDRARWRPDGSIDFLGRIDHQVKIRGFRVEIGEIEYRLLRIPGIKEAVVLPKTDRTGEKYLCAYAAPSGIGADIIKEHLSRSLPNYMVPSHFVLLEKFLLTPNGKIDRKSLPEPDAAAGIKTGRDDAPRDRLEQRLTDIWRELLVREQVGIYDDFFEIGGHSLKALHLLNLLQKEFNVKIDFQDIFQFPTIAELSDIIRNRETTRLSEILPSEEKEFYELSYTQQRLWLLYQFDPGDPAFNLPERITLRGPVEKDVIRKVFQVLAKRHDAFRSCFSKVNGEPVMLIRSPERTPVVLETVDISHLDETEQSIKREQLFIEEGIRPFVLDCSPLYRLKLVTCGGGEYDLLLTMHHIITDGWSMEVLEKEFFTLYNAYKQRQEGEALLSPLRIRYSDYAAWHNRQLADREGMKAARLFWESRLNGSNPVLDLPYDFPSENKENKESAAYRLVVPESVLQGLRGIANERKASLFTVLLAAYSLMLFRITGQNDITLALPGAARQHDDLKNIVGLFVNTLIFKCEIDPGESFTHLLERVRSDMFQVLDHQSYPLELICSEFKLRYPEISVFFNMSIFGTAFDRPLEDVDSYHIARVQNAKFEIVDYVGEYKNAVEISTHYYSALFKSVTIEKMMQMYLTILEGISRDPEKPLKEYFKPAGKRRISWS